MKCNLQRTLLFVQTTSLLADPSVMVLILWFYVVIRFLNIQNKKQIALIYVYTFCRSKTTPFFIIVLSNPCLNQRLRRVLCHFFRESTMSSFAFFFIPLSCSHLDIVDLQEMYNNMSFDTLIRAI